MKEIRLEMPYGGLLMSQESIDLLGEFFLAKGDHVEIGSAWGYSAITAALLKPKGKVYAIDPISSHPFYGEGVEPISGEVLTVEKLRTNIEANGVADRVVHVDAFSDPWPLPGQTFVTALIDGDHTYEGVLRDWANVKDRVTGFVMFHDVLEISWPDVTRAWQVVCRDPEWVPFKIQHNIGVVARADIIWKKFYPSSTS